MNVQWCDIKVRQQVVTPGAEVLSMLLRLKYLSQDMDIRCWCVIK